MSEQAIVKNWDDLTSDEQRKIFADFLQCEGYADDGTEYQTLGDYYHGTRRYATLEMSEAEQALRAVEDGRICGWS